MGERLEQKKLRKQIAERSAYPCEPVVKGEITTSAAKKIDDVGRGRFVAAEPIATFAHHHEQSVNRPQEHSLRAEPVVRFQASCEHSSARGHHDAWPQLSLVQPAAEPSMAFQNDAFTRGPLSVH